MPNLALQNVRRLIEWSQRDRVIDWGNVAAESIPCVGIIGAGIMGTSIAAAHVRHGVPVIIVDNDPAAAARAPQRIAKDLAASDTPLSAATMNSLIQATSDLAALRQCKLVIETIVENLAAKQKLYSQLRGHLEPATIVGSNTSAIPLRDLAEALPDQSRFCGLHFCHPVRLRPLVEIIRGSRTSNQTMASIVEHVKRIDRLPIEVEDGPGFVVNRLLFPYISEALELLREGVPPAAIEQAAIYFGMTFGPLRMMDEMGLDTTLHAGWVLANAFPERVVPSPLLVTMIKAGRIGRKAGIGFYSYDAASDEAVGLHPDPAIEDLMARWIERPQVPFTGSLAERLILPMLLEATRLLEEGKRLGDIDLAVLFGLGFPQHTGGLLWWADTLGAAQLVASLRAWNISRLQPTPMLDRCAGQRASFYSVPPPSLETL